MKIAISSLPSKRSIQWIAACCLVQLLVATAAAALPPLTSPPLGDRWFSISMNGDRVGFAHVNVTATPDGFRISSEGSAKMLVLGFSREATARERYEVNPDLTLKSFEVEQTIDKSPLNLSGTVSGRTVKLTVTSKGGKHEKSLKSKGAVYPPPVVNLYPLIKGFAPGKKYSLQMLDVEAVKLKEVSIKGIGIEKRYGMDTFHLQNDLYTFVDNDIWVDSSGNTIEESVRDGLILTKTEDAKKAVAWLFEDAIAKKDLVLDFSLIKITEDLQAQEKLRQLTIELTGYPAGYPLPEGPGQTAARQAPDRIKLSMKAPLRQTGEQATLIDKTKYLQTTPRINSDNPEIVALQRQAIAGNASPEQTVAALTRWVADFLEDSVTDSHSAVEALQLRKGNCQSHARLYVAMARAAGIPSRMVSGLVYIQGKGFLYHSWAESYAEGWIAVDPTFGQAPADITHIRLVEGDEPEEMAPLAGIVGRIKAKVIDKAN
ncbi:transglutaminase-like domain-containing protein [Geobacter pelophilus]|uniref:Transglutaminase-like domain-containing protein n=1 Tax=Geoanaerobacter pelophilus TaxID=60036 RepID=A0AAW4L841_9BACT|nr:transglutaminase-like domain-containing protein [Geoanaerobacter pelophilus]MBT0665198.1 transglutaminase-like domain-containing protein [Geoanaerobacter pelophilus]